MKDKNFKNDLWTKYDYIIDGHGGALAEEMRAASAQTVMHNGLDYTDETQALLKMNTVPWRKGNCRKQASDLLQNPEKLREPETLEKAGKLIQQYMLLCGLSRDKYGTREDVPWLSIDKVLKDPSGDPTLRELSGDGFNADVAQELLSSMTTSKERSFTDKVSETARKLSEDRLQKQRIQDERKKGKVTGLEEHKIDDEERMIDH